MYTCYFMKKMQIDEAKNKYDDEDIFWERNNISI